MATISQLEEPGRGRARRRYSASVHDARGGSPPFGIRFWLHLAIVAVVGSSALLGGGHLLQPPTKTTQQAAAQPAPAAEATPLAEAVALPAPLVSAPRPTATVMPVAASAPAPARVVEASAPAPREVVAEALSLPIEHHLDLLAVGQEDGVVAVRAGTSARGGARAPEAAPTAAPAPTASPTAAPSPTPARKEPLKPQTYKVVAGDTLLGIASRFGITPETVLWANDLGNGELLQIGEELTILPVSGVLHKVSRGETFNQIAEAYTTDPAKIIGANQLTNADLLQDGQILVVPGGMLRTVSVSGLPSAPSAQELAAAPKYTVKQGDTLLSIAETFGVRASVIQVANNLLDPDMLKLGQVLSIPGGKQAGPAPRPAAAPAAAPKPAAPAAAPRAAAPAPEPAPVSGGAGDQIAAISQRYLGYRYVWGGTSPQSGFDCSGFAWYVYKQAGIGIPRAPLEGQIGAGPRISRDKLLPGDLVFFQNTYKAGLSHVGIYLGGGRWINAESEAVGVQIRSLSDPFWAARYVGASRPW